MSETHAKRIAGPGTAAMVYGKSEAPCLIHAPSARRQPPAASLTLDAPYPRTRVPMLLGAFVVAVFVLGLASWAALAPLAEAAIAPGILKVEGTRRTIQHFEGGIVREILVRDGDVVQQG